MFSLSRQTTFDGSTGGLLGAGAGGLVQGGGDQILMPQPLGPGLCAPHGLLCSQSSQNPMFSLSLQTTFDGSTGGLLSAGAGGLVQGGGDQIFM